jgi:hypothetical protein
MMLESKSQLIRRENRRRPNQTLRMKNSLSSSFLLRMLLNDRIGQDNVMLSLLIY